MTPERWQEIDQLLTTALELEPEPRAAFLLQLAERDRELHAQVHTLLAAAERSSGFLESNLAEISRFSLPPQFVWQEGQLVAHYEVVSTLGAGGMGEVYLARDRKLGRRVALKLLPPFSTTIPDRVRRFELEARAASALNHPNILTIYEIGQHAGLHFIASEFVEGVTLRQKIAHGPLTLAESLDLISQVLAALSAAHSASIVHRDIKPENVMVRPDGLVKVLDFGLAKLHGGEAIQATSESSADADIKLHSMQSALMGTPPYMSPEQARGLDVDTRTDLFSLGVMLYEMVTGYPPFNGETVADMINALIEQEPLPLPAGRFPATLTEILRRCLAKNPHLRYGSARNVAQDLQLLAAELKPEGAAEISRSSIAILPFVDLSGDPDNELFCDGLAEDLLNALAKIERLHVAARTSAFSFKRKNADIREIGRLLKVETVLEGSVRRAGNQLRIMVQLVNAADGYHLWSERYDRQINDLFRIQDEITLALVQALKVQLLGEEKARLLKKYTDNTDAYQLYVKGRAYCHRATREGFDKAIEFFEQATAIEPDYAPAWAGIVYAYLSLAFHGYPREGLTAKCANALPRALALDPDQHDVCLALGSFKLFYQWDFSGAEREFKRAIQLAPNLAGVYFPYAAYLSFTERFDEALAQARRAEELDPLSIYAVSVLGWSHWYARRYEEVLVQVRKLIEMEPNFFGAYWLRGMTQLHLGAYDEAIADVKRAVNLGAGLHTLSSLGICYGKAGQRVEAEAVLATLLDRRGGEPVQAFFLALVYASLEDTDKTLEWLEKACDERNDVLLGIQVTTVFEFLDDHPRFTEILQRIGFPAAR